MNIPYRRWVMAEFLRKATVAAIAMIVALAVAGGAMLYVLYRVELAAQTTSIESMVTAHAASWDHHVGSASFADGMNDLYNFGATGEFVMARRVGDAIEVAARRSLAVDTVSALLPPSSDAASLYAVAIDDEPGTTVTKDHRGETVLAAHAPMRDLGWGLVAKLDLRELRAPFVQAAILGTAGGILIILVTVILTAWLFYPVFLQLRTNLSSTNAMIDGAVDGIITIDDRGIVQTANPAALGMFGWDDLVGQNVSILMPEPTAFEHVSFLAAHGTTGRASAIGTGRELSAVRRDGRSIPIWLSVSEFWAGGQRLYTGILRDLGPEREAQALRVSAERFHLAVEGTEEALWDWNIPTGVVYRSARWHGMLGYPNEETESDLQTWERLLHPADHARTRECMNDHLAGRTTRYMAEYRLKARSGKWMWIHDVGRVVQRDEAGRPLRMTGLQRDMTLQKEAELALVAAKETAEAATEAKARFLATMSHEIRTPLNGVLGMAGLLSDTPLASEQLDYVETILSSGASLLTIVNDVLDFSKAEANQLTIEPHPFDLGVAVEEVADLLAVRAEEKGLELLVRHEFDPRMLVVGDAGRVRQILLNLVSNAIKFTASGEVVIDIRCVESGGRDAQFQLSVRDTGMGIPAERIPHMFDEFTQADETTTRRFGGTGLGLAISKRLAELMGGTIEVESVVNEGTIFRVTLRLELDRRPTPKVLASASLDRVRVLVVDDNETNRKILREQLTVWGVRCSTCSGGREAMRQLLEASDSDDCYRLVIVDNCMSGMSGEELGAAVRRTASLRDIPLVLMTSTAARGDAARSEAIGFAGYLPKPARRDRLRAVLETVLGAQAEGLKPGLVTQHTIAERQREKPVRPGTKPRVLLAEDNIVNQKVAVRMLERLGCRVDVAANGREAVTMARALPYDIIFMDCRMPDMDGLEATAALRMSEGGENRTAIVALTADAMEEDRRRCLEVGMDDFLAKPVRQDAIGHVLDRLLTTVEVHA